ncbi:hypothetical protein MPSEU_000898200 [Mayamaea pseudoterrestris]|nr:hypothetical protein MPSEU_000898200 [Mayamaea pseudoterrestris]
MDSDSDSYLSSALSGLEDDFLGSDDDSPVKLPTKPKKKIVLASKENAMNSAPPKATSSKGKSKTVEEMYQKKTQLEHILLRPDTYIGSIERDTKTMFVLDGDRIVEKEIVFTPGLFKIFDEIVVNAADNKQRDPNMDKLDIVVHAEEGFMSVRNNGKGIPIVMHKDEKIYVPSMIFGQLLTGSNFDDNEQKTTGGRNGYGAKLANVFSTKFIVECLDVKNGLKFKQVFRNNMTVKEEPKVTKISASERKEGDYVKITFYPDYARFGMSGLDKDTVALFSKRAYDIAGTMAASSGKKLVVTLNEKKLPIKTFKDFLAHIDGLDAAVAYEKGERWEVGVSASRDASQHHVSFVNAINTYKGGNHVSYIADQVAAHLAKVLKRRKKISEPKPNQIKNHLNIFVSCLIVNPTFDSQTKEFLTSKPKTFGSEFKLSEKFLKAVEKSDIVTTIESYMNFRDNQALKKKGGTKKIKLTGIAKLDDANHAGSCKSSDCTLILTEGDSAKSLAMSGIAVVGRDYYGCFPLRGKLLNVRDAETKKIMANEEIKNLVDILGLKFGTQYDSSNIKTLRYGKLMIMSDQDVDGSHIKGLVINFIHKFWPGLLDVPGFMQQFITPIVKASKGKQTKTFFTLPEYEEWMETTGNNGKGWTIKYYKGLGTSTSTEAKEYFSNLDLHEVHFARMSIDPTGSDLIDMVFKKDRANDRKDWLNATSKDDFMDYIEASAKGGVKYSEFINKEYIQFSHYDNERSIPSIIDGFKPSQRKVLFACFKRKLKHEIKVAQLTGYVAEHAVYHHGEASLQQTIINMAQNFCGSNNVNVLTPSGQFGTRRMGGKDAASPRYIFTSLEPIARAIFHPDDDELLHYLNDDGISVEPQFYVPVIPMVLVNGADGIGTGWSSSVNNYDPREIIANLRALIMERGEMSSVQDMRPSYCGFSGDIVSIGQGKYKVQGKIERLSDTTMLISELPIRKWTQDYKEALEKMLVSDAKSPPELLDFKENHTDTTVSFTLTAERAKIDEWEKSKDGLIGKFKLTSSLSETNMVLFDKEGSLVRYESTADILKTFYDVRIEFYHKRKDLLICKLEREQHILSNKARFVEEVCSGILVVNNRRRNDILLELKQRGYEMYSSKDDHIKSDAEVDGEDMEQSQSELSQGYEYLMGMKLWSLTMEKVDALKVLLVQKTAELDSLRLTSPDHLWSNDLDAIEKALDERDLSLAAAADGEKRAQVKNAKHRAKLDKKKPITKKKNFHEWDSHQETSSDDDVMEVDSNDDKSISMPVMRKPTFDRTMTFAKGKTSFVATKTASKPAAKAKATTKVAPAAATKAAFEIDSDSDVSDKSMSLMERIKKVQVSPPLKVLQPKPIKHKRPSPKMADLESEDSVEVLDDEMLVEASLTPTTKSTKLVQPVKRARKKEATSKNDHMDSDLDFRGDSDDESRKQPASRLPRHSRAVLPKAYTLDDSDDEDSASDMESDSDF